MYTFHRIVALILCAIISLSLCGCDLPFLKKNTGEPKAEAIQTTKPEKTPKPEKIETDYVAKTNIQYSSGSDSNWSYSTQRKEFPRNEACYVRVGSNVYSEKKKGVGKDIDVTYKITGTKNCAIELADGIAKIMDSDDENVLIYTRTINAEKDNNQTENSKTSQSENSIIFQYMPDNEAKSVTIEVIYDEHVPEQYDKRSTIYFSDEKE